MRSPAQPLGPRGRNDEDGIALFYALLVTLVVGGLVAIVFATAIGEQRQAAFELDFEDTIHVAEAGAEIYLGRLVDDNELNSGVDGPDALGVDPADWAVDEATRKVGGAYVHPAVPSAEGETVAIRPTGEDAEFVYGVGFTPSRDAYVNGIGEPYVRVVRVQVAFAPNIYDPQHAMLTGGNLKLAGNYKIEGSNGAVHTNGAIEITGSSGTASGGVSYSGSCTKGCGQASGPVAPEEIQALKLEDFWDSPEAEVVTAENDFYEYCSGTWYRRSIAANAPCDGTGTVVGPGNPSIQPWSGTSYNNPAAPTDGVFYFNGDVDVDVKSPTGKLSIFTGGDIAIGPSSNTAPPDARYPGWYLFAEGSITIGGNAASGSFATAKPAVVWANKTIDLKGTLETNEIAFVAIDDASIGSSYAGGGNGRIRFNGNASIVVPGEKVPLVVQWDEIFAP